MTKAEISLSEPQSLLNLLCGTGLRFIISEFVSQRKLFMDNNNNAMDVFECFASTVKTYKGCDLFPKDLRLIFCITWVFTGCLGNSMIEAVLTL